MKPPYRVPTMPEIRALPSDGPVVVSTFSGAGGSCLGFRLAGYRVAWASEFVEAARLTYSANWPETPVDDRDIRRVHPTEILAAIGLDVGELDVLEGSPPCSSFSMAGKRDKGWGETRHYSGERSQRTDDLFPEFGRLLRGLRPRTFVAENVAGLARGKAKGYLLEILRDLRTAGYRVEARLLDAQWLGVPQRRERIVFVGVREDLGLDPVFPAPLPYRYSIRDVLPIPVEGTYVLDEVLARIKRRTRSSRGQGVEVGRLPSGVLGIAYLQPNEVVAGDAAPLIAGYAIGAEAGRLSPGGHSTRYLNLVRAHQDEPSPTVTAAGGGSDSSPGGVAAVVHPTEPRKFSIDELRAICSFPPDYVLTGSYADQWERLGRSVPPLMMRAVAETLRTEVLDRA